MNVHRHDRARLQQQQQQQSQSHTPPGKPTIVYSRALSTSSQQDRYRISSDTRHTYAPLPCTSIKQQTSTLFSAPPSWSYGRPENVAVSNLDDHERGKNQAEEEEEEQEEEGESIVFVKNLYVETDLCVGVNVRKKQKTDGGRIAAVSMAMPCDGRKILDEASRVEEIDLELRLGGCDPPKVK